MSKERERKRRAAGRRESGATSAVRLTRKYAEMIDGVDLSEATVGDRLDLPHREAGVLIAEGWAEPVRDSARPPGERSNASDRPSSAGRRPKR